jgi:ribosomal protein S18 acetylase RimI-like enzyme
LEALAEAHDRVEFSCGEEVLDRYLQTQVGQDIRRNITNCFVAIEAASGRLAGYYTLAACSIPTPDMPASLTRKLPRYPSVPAVRIGRLAVDTRFHGRGLGAALLGDATLRTVSSAPAAYALVVDAKHDKAVAFYEHHGFLNFASKERTLFLPLATAAKVFVITAKS